MEVDNKENKKNQEGKRNPRCKNKQRRYEEEGKSRRRAYFEIWNQL